MSGKQGQGIVANLAGRLGHFFIIFGYLWLLLSVYALHNSIVLADWRLLSHIGPQTVNALLFAKFLLIGEHLKVGARFEDRPLIWAVLIKAALFAIVLVGFDYLEGVIVDAIWPHAAKGDGGMELTNVRTIVAFSLMTFVALIPFFGIRELTHVIGEEQIRNLFFHTHTKFKLVPKA